MQTVLMILLTVMAGASVAAQATLSGSWAGKTPNGFQMTLDLTAKGQDLSGTFARNGQTVAITNGKVSGGRFTFTVPVKGQPQEFAGEQRGDEVMVWMTAQGASSAAVLQRVKKSVQEFAGRWQGATPTGRPLELHLEPAGTGSITVMQEPAKILETKMEGDRLSFSAGALEGRTIVGTVRFVGPDLELTVQGVGAPIMLKRVK